MQESYLLAPASLEALQSYAQEIKSQLTGPQLIELLNRFKLLPISEANRIASSLLKISLE